MQPTSESPIYRLRVEHDRGRVPRVFIESPQIDSSVSHVYREGHLCLYWPEEWEWSAREKLAETLIPWTALWIYYYEIWQFCGKWLGPSSPH